MLSQSFNKKLPNSVESDVAQHTEISGITPDMQWYN